MSNPARLLFIAPVPPPVTGQSLASDVIRADLARDAEVQLDLVNLSKRSLRSGIGSFGRVLEVIGIFGRVALGARRARAIYFTISESRAGNLKDLVLLCLCLGKLDRTVVHLHGGAGMLRLLGPGRWAWRALNRCFLFRVSSVVVLGDSLRPIFDGIVAPERVSVVRNFAVSDLFSTPETVREKFRVGGGLKVLFLSNLIDGKGHDELLRAFLALEESERNRISLDFAGAFYSLEEELDFKRRIAPYRNIRYHGVVSGETKRLLLQQTHVFCLPTYYAFEGQPISILEAYAAGCAVITTDHSGIPDIFVPTVNGTGVKPRSVDDLAAALSRCVGCFSELEAQALRNLVEAQARYRPEHYCLALGRIIRASLR